MYKHVGSTCSIQQKKIMSMYMPLIAKMDKDAPFSWLPR
jgi:hypothetical protein